MLLAGLMGVSLPLAAQSTLPQAAAPQNQTQNSLAQCARANHAAAGQAGPAAPARSGKALILSASTQQQPAQSAAPAAQPPASQEPEVAAPGDEEGTYTLKQNVNEVNLTFTVTDRRGHFVNNLQQQDFAIARRPARSCAGLQLYPADESAAARRPGG